jgi:alkylation response protein AidB-like acyl-CoA dehydrogenase
MPYREIDLNVSKETLAMQKEVHEFAKKVMRPVGIELDRMPDPADVIAKDSVLWDAFKAYRGMDLHMLQMPKAFGGMAEDLDPMAAYLMGEEMGYGDVGLAVSLGVSNMPFNFAALFQHVPELKQMVHDYCEDKDGQMVGCWAITEPDHGGDWSLGGEDPRCGPSVVGVLKGDEYIVNGEKSAWVSNGTIATHAVLHVGLVPDKGMAGSGLAIIPLDLSGISKDKPLDKMGQRPLNQGSIIFQDARIPKQYMVIGEEAIELIAGMGETILSGANGGMSVFFAGLAKAAFDEAFRYSQERIQGGVPIFEHQNIKLKLFKMFTMVEAVRANSRRMALYNAAHPEAPSGTHAVAAKCLATETATFVASEAMQILGGNGLAREYPVEKMYRDARAGMIEDGVNETLSLAAVEFLL